MILFTLVLAIAGTNAASQRTIEIGTLSGKYLVFMMPRAFLSKMFVGG